MKIIYMGTPEIAVPALNKIVESGYEVLACVTQPDRPKGRKSELVACPVKEAALAHNIHVIQPEKARDPEFINEIKNLNPDVIVVMAYGQILTKDLLDIPALGCVNIHASLLPKYRGAAPISAVILNGEKETGVTTMYMDEGLDTGDMILTNKVQIDKNETTQSLESKVAAAGANVIIETLKLIEEGKAPRTKQNDEDATYIKMIKKEEGLVNWNDEATFIERKIRAYYPWPGTYTTFNGIRIKIFDADVVADTCDAEVGTIIEATSDGILVACGKDVLKINNLQAEGKKRMDTPDFLRGFKLSKGDVFGN